MSGTITMATASHIFSKTAAIPVHAVWGAAAGLVGGVGMASLTSIERTRDLAGLDRVAASGGRCKPRRHWPRPDSGAGYCRVRCHRTSTC